MERDKHERAIIESAIDEWEQQNVLPSETANQLRQTLVTRTDSRGQLSQYFFVIAVSSALLAFGSLFIDEKIIEHLRRTFLLSNYTIAFGSAIASALLYYLVEKRKAQLPMPTYEAYLIPGTLLAIVALVYLCKEIGNGASYSFFLGANTVLLMALSTAFRSRVIWVAAILSAMGWAGAFTTAYSHENLFLGMNYPVRFTVFGLIVLGVSQVQKGVSRMAGFSKLTYQLGLLIFYTGLWGVSIFGNYGSLDRWRAVRQTHVLVYALIFGICAGVGLYMGIKKDDDALRDYSVLFLLLNLYTRYFEYLYSALNKGLFFLFLAVSFWFLGRWLAGKKKVVNSANDVK